MTRPTIETEIGQEVQCTQCGEFWPADHEFFYFTRGKPRSKCKACELSSPATVAKRARRRLEYRAAAQAAAAQP